MSFTTGLAEFKVCSSLKEYEAYLITTNLDPVIAEVQAGTAEKPQDLMAFVAELISWEKLWKKDHCHKGEAALGLFCFYYRDQIHSIKERFVGALPLTTKDLNQFFRYLKETRRQLRDHDCETIFKQKNVCIAPRPSTNPSHKLRKQIL